MGSIRDYEKMWSGAFDDVPEEHLDGIGEYTGLPGQAINEFLRDGKGKLCDQWDKALLQKWADNASKVFDKVKNKSNVIVYRCANDLSFLPQSGTFTDKGFGSCSTKPNLMFGSKVMKIQVPKGARGGFVKSLSTEMQENEFLLDKNTKYDILYTKKIRINGEKHDCVVLRVKK